MRLSDGAARLTRGGGAGGAGSAGAARGKGRLRERRRRGREHLSLLPAIIHLIETLTLSGTNHAD